MFDTGMKLKKEKKRKSRFIARLRSTLSRTCCSVCLSLWEIYTVYCSCSLYGTMIPDPETLETVSPYQLNTVLKLCHCLVFTEIPGLPLNSKEINSIQFSSPVLHLLSDFFHCLTAHKLVKFITTQMFFHFHVANIMAPGLMSYLCFLVLSNLALSELQCGLYALWLVTFSVAWSVCMSVYKKQRWN